MSSASRFRLISMTPLWLAGCSTRPFPMTKAITATASFAEPSTGTSALAARKLAPDAAQNRKLWVDRAFDAFVQRVCCGI